MLQSIDDNKYVAANYLSKHDFDSNDDFDYGKVGIFKFPNDKLRT